MIPGIVPSFEFANTVDDPWNSRDAAGLHMPSLLQETSSAALVTQAGI
jgi:hypothetical protein